MAIYKRGNVWWTSFVLAGKRIQESTKTSRKTLAVEYERNRRLDFERALVGMPVPDRSRRIRSVSELIKPYLASYRNSHRPKSILFAEGRLSHVQRLLGKTIITDLTEQKIHEYIAIRLAEKVSGRTVNMEIGELSRVIGKTWSVLWPKVRHLEERKDIGIALSEQQETKLLDTVPKIHAPMLGTIVRVALLTGMRSGEILSMRWSQIDFHNRVLNVGKAKTEAGTRREIPMGPPLFEILSGHAAWFARRFGSAEPSWYVFPFGSPTPSDPSRHLLDIKTAWGNLRKISRINCRFHDLRHTFATKLAEEGIGEGTMKSLLGHTSKRMLEHYSHVRMAAKRDAVESVRLHEPDRTGKTEEIVVREKPRVN